MTPDNMQEKQHLQNLEFISLQSRATPENNSSSTSDHTQYIQGYCKS